MAAKTLRFLRANVIGCLALFVALSAGAYAASTKAPKGSVVTKSIAKGAVKTKQLGNKSVTEGKLGAGAVTEAKIKKFAYTTVGTLENGWLNVGTGPNPSYGKDALGFVHLRGRIRAGTLNTSAFTLPAGFRPAESESFGTGTIFGGNSTPCIVSVSTTGTVVIGVTGADTGCAPAGSTLLYGITFRADGS